MSRENDHSAYENWIDPASVTPYERNAKEHTEKQKKAVTGIETEPTTVRRSGVWFWRRW